nr:unnamed protein product [Callosobruchus analis]
MPKKDVDVPICADFRATVNKALNVDQYHLPKPEDIFASLAGGCVFTVLDLSGAYQQLKVSPEYQKYLTVNTHLGMYQYTRLAYVCDGYDMPYALKPKVEKKIKQMVHVGIIKAVNYSEWGSPIVVMPKKDGDVPICADFRATVNKALNVDQYHLPKPEDIFASLAGGCVFTVLDLSGAYQQLKVSPEYQNSINSSKLSEELPVSYKDIANVSSKDAVLMKVIDYVKSGSPSHLASNLKPYYVCQKSQNNQERFLVSWPKTENVSSRIHIDFFHAENKIFLLIVDSKSKWVDIYHMSKVMGLSDMIVSDNGPLFNSAEFTKFCHVNGIEVIKTPPYHAQSNRCAERHVQNVKDALTKHLLSKSTLKIEQRIVNFLFSYRNTPTSCGMSPNEIIFKVKPKTRLDLLKPKNGGQVDIKKSKEFLRPPILVVGEKAFVDDQVMYKHVNSLRKNMCNEQQLETVELRSPCVDKTPSIDLFCNPNMTTEPQPEPSSSQVASPALAESARS